MDEHQTSVEEVVIDNSSPAPETVPDDLIAQISAEYNPDGDTTEAAADVAPAVDAETGTEEVQAQSEGEPAESESDDKEADRGIERLVAREVELRQKEEAFRAREAKVVELEKQNAELKAKVDAFPADFIEEMRFRPTEALEAAGHDPDHVVRLILAAKMQKEGKPVPPELRQAIRDAEYDYKFQKQERELQQMKHQRAALEFAAKVESDARQYVTKGISKDAPTVAQVAKANPDRVFSEILDEISRDAAARAREPGAQLISFDEASRRVEKRWSEFKSLLNPGTEASTTAGETKSTKPAPGASKPTTPKAATPPSKPLTAPKPKTEDELLKLAIAEAEAEHKRATQVKRA